MGVKVEINANQRRNLEDLWFVYGNHGKKHTMSSHRFIQEILEKGMDRRDFFRPPPECVKAVDEILEKK